jgi:hypothetical protein
MFNKKENNLIWETFNTSKQVLKENSPVDVSLSQINHLVSTVKPDASVMALEDILLNVKMHLGNLKAALPQKGGQIMEIAKKIMHVLMDVPKENVESYTTQAKYVLDELKKELPLLKQ